MKRTSLHSVLFSETGFRNRTSFVDGENCGEPLEIAGLFPVEPTSQVYSDGFPPRFGTPAASQFQSMSFRLSEVARPTRSTAVPTIHEFKSCAGSHAFAGPFGRLLSIRFIRDQRAEPDVVLPRCGCAPDRQEL